MDQVYYFKELIALIVCLIIVLFPLILRYVFFRFFRSNRKTQVKAKQAPVARESRSPSLAPGREKAPPKDPKVLPNEQFLKHIKRSEVESVSHLERSALGPENVYPPVPLPVETRTPEDTVLPASAFDHILGKTEGRSSEDTVLPASVFDHILGKTEERTPEATVLPGATLSHLLDESSDTVFPKSALDRLFPDSMENEQVILSQHFGRTPAERTAEPARYWKRAPMRSGGWSRLNQLPPLKRAIVLSEVLGSPKGIAFSNSQGFASGNTSLFAEGNSQGSRVT